jgi:arsenical pump membrane protein
MGGSPAAEGKDSRVLFLIAAVAMLLVGIRPRGIPEWVWAVAGAALVVLLGYESAGNALSAVAQRWNVLLFILGLMGLSAAAEESGAFEWLADVLLQRAGGSRRRLFILLFLAGGAITCLLSNDATAIVFTPIVYRAVARRGGNALPFLFGCIFVADTASFGLPFANPANIIVLPRPNVLDYLWHLGAPEVLAVAINLLIFLAIFRISLRGSYEFDAPIPPCPEAKRTLAALCCVGAAYLVALLLGWPLGPVAVAGALLTIAVARVSPAAAMRHVGWSTFALLAGLFALVDAIARAGFVAWASHGLEAAARYGALASVSVACVGSALLSNLLNNLPVAVASSYVVAHAPAQSIAYPLIAGIDLGPNLTTAGSLATILWLAVLRARGVHVSALEYLRLGAMVVPPMIAVNVLWLWLVR